MFRDNSKPILAIDCSERKQRYKRNYETNNESHTGRWHKMTRISLFLVIALGGDDKQDEHFSNTYGLNEGINDGDHLKLAHYNWAFFSSIQPIRILPVNDALDPRATHHAGEDNRHNAGFDQGFTIFKPIHGWAAAREKNANSLW